MRSFGMPFIGWQFAGVLSLALLMLVLSILGFRRARKMRRQLLRIVVQLLCVPLGILGSLATLLLLAGSGCESHSAIFRSPSGTVAARIDDSDEGALGGSTTVELFTALGLRRQTVFLGEWKSVQPGDIHWENDLKLTVSYRGQPNYCKSTTVVKVNCIQRPE